MNTETIFFPHNSISGGYGGCGGWFIPRANYMNRTITVLEHIDCLVEHANDYRKLAKYRITNFGLIR